MPQAQLGKYTHVVNRCVRMNLSAVGKKYDLRIPSVRRATEAYVKVDLANVFTKPLLEYLWRIGKSYPR